MTSEELIAEAREAADWIENTSGEGWPAEVPVPVLRALCDRLEALEAVVQRTVRERVALHLAEQTPTFDNLVMQIEDALIAMKHAQEAEGK